ncbi:hypothetical protein M9H77_07316 [Catharanthus roseus]|uniref:Uncharacterized protein n=1 Tax=Catharanthus roseus TaxID=4058 RepID=A0ACC0BUM5_CATRO|nr:hypothetical protein M9H77_07316 [Catharanthus roseus]
MYNEHNDSPSYNGYNFRRSSQTLGTRSRPFSYNNLKLYFLWGTFCPYDYVTWEREVESLFYSYAENGIASNQQWSLMKQPLRIRCRVGNHEGLGQGQPDVKFIESSMVVESLKVKEHSQAKIEENLKIHVVE